VDSFAGKVIDAVGAGDALLAYATLSLLSDESEVAASVLGSMAAALECECDGNIPIGRSDLLGRIEMVEKQARFEGRARHFMIGVMVAGIREHSDKSQ